MNESTWTPKPGEWCWFEGIDSFPMLVQYTGQQFNDTYKVCINKSDTLYVKNLTEFEGTIPSFIPYKRFWKSS